MIEMLLQSLREWNKSTDERVKLQYSYVVAAFILLFIAGLISLANNDLGQTVLQIAVALVAIATVNAVAWALLNSFVLQKLGKAKTPRK